MDIRDGRLQINLDEEAVEPGLLYDGISKGPAGDAASFLMRSALRNEDTTLRGDLVFSTCDDPQDRVLDLRAYRRYEVGREIAALVEADFDDDL